MPYFSESELDTSPRSLVKALKLTSPVKSTMAEKKSCNLTDLLKFMVQRDEERRQEVDRLEKKKLRKERKSDNKKREQGERRLRKGDD